MEEYSEAREVPGVKVFRSSATVYFANADLYCDALKQRCGVDVDHLIARKKKLLRKRELALKRLQKEPQPQAAASSTGTLVPIDVSTSDGAIKSHDGDDPKAQVSSEQEPAEPAAGGQEDGQAPGGGTLKGLGLHPPPFHSLVLDLGALSFVDTVCIKSLKNILHDFREIEVEVYLAGCQAPVVAQLEAGHFFDGSVSKRDLFASVHDAVLYALRRPRAQPASPALVTKL